MKLNTEKTMVMLVLVASIVLIYQSLFAFSWSAGPNYANVSIDTRVNITNAPPTVTTVVIDELVNGADNLTLAAGSTRTIYCNATIRDWNGWADINRTNGTFWDNNVAGQYDALNNSAVYRNSTCAKVGDDGQYLAYWQCTFDVYYYANNGSDWRCNVTTVDNASYVDSNYNTTTISPLYALNMTATQIDYGNVAVEAYSGNQNINSTNFGNMDINVSVHGYGHTPNDDLAFNCSVNSNITIGNERYSTSSGDAWAAKTNLTSTPVDVGYTIPQQVGATQTSNITYWEVYIPVEGGEAPAGLCTGTVVFTATTP